MAGPVEEKQTRDKGSRSTAEDAWMDDVWFSTGQLVMAAIAEHSRKQEGAAGGKLDWEIGYQARREQRSQRGGERCGLIGWTKRVF